MANSSELKHGMVQVELNHMTPGYRRALKDTLAVFRDVASYLIHVAADNWEVIKDLDSNQSCAAMEHLVHKTKSNPNPAYGTFDKLFYKLPSYIRRAAIHAATGHLSSHETRCDQYYEERQIEVDRKHHYKKMEPRFTYTPNACPILYKSNMFLMDSDCRVIRIKVRIRNTWDWISVSMPKRDAKCLKKAMTHGKVSNPKLVYKYHKFYLQFPVEYSVKDFPELPLQDQVVMGTDLGFNTGAVCSAVNGRGEVLYRAFSPFAAKMQRILHVIGLISKYQRMSGRGQSLSKLYTKLKGLKEDYANQLARWIVNQAIYCNAYGIVLEHLISIHGGKKPRGLRAKVHHWCVAKIRDLVKGMAFREGIRVFIINPNGTSQNAYDGSGPLLRGKDAGFNSYALCKFASGKVYNCDLNASYNIAARYFLRAVKKSTPATEWSGLVAKVPGLEKRTRWVLDTLIKTSAIMYPQKACAA